MARRADLPSERQDASGGARWGDDEDRRLNELTAELRVMLSGISVVFAFLLTLPFTARFESLPLRDEIAYLTAFLAITAALVLSIGESAYHRVRGHPYPKRRLLVTADRQAVGALLLLSIAVPAVVFLVLDVVLGLLAAVVAASATAVLAVWTWFALPGVRRLRDSRQHRP